MLYGRQGEIGTVFGWVTFYRMVILQGIATQRETLRGDIRWKAKAPNGCRECFRRTSYIWPSVGLFIRYSVGVLDGAGEVATGTRQLMGE